jgi:hypothetical protein
MNLPVTTLQIDLKKHTEVKNDMKEINLKLETKKVECETISIKTAIVVEEGTPEIVIPKKIRKEVEKLLIEELKVYTR